MKVKSQKSNCEIEYFIQVGSLYVKLENPQPHRIHESKIILVKDMEEGTFLSSKDLIYKIFNLCGGKILKRTRDITTIIEEITNSERIDEKNETS